MKNRHCSYTKKVQRAIANLWIASLPIPLFAMETEQLVQDQVSVTTQATETQARQQPTEPVEPIEKIGIQGNWLKKREWLIKAYEITNEIQEIAAQTEQVRKSFIDAYNEINTTLDTYYKDIGLDDGKIQGLFDSIKRYLEKKQKQERASLGVAADEKLDPSMQAKIESIEEAIKPLKQQLSQLKLDMKSIEDLDKSLADRIKRVDEQIGVMQEQATNSKNIAHQMWDIIDHNKAREQYYNLKLSILEKVKAINSYLKEDLYKDFGSVIGTIKTQITRTQEQIKKLEADGLIIKNRAQRIKELKLNPEAQQSAATEKKDQIEQTAQKSAQAPGLFTKIYNAIITISTYPLDLIQWIKEKITGPKPTTQTVNARVQTSQQPIPVQPMTTPSRTPQSEALPSGAPTP